MVHGKWKMPGQGTVRLRENWCFAGFLCRCRVRLYAMVLVCTGRHVPFISAGELIDVMGSFGDEKVLCLVLRR